MSEKTNNQILFDRFRIDAILQKDQFSCVYSAWHIDLDIKILLKTLDTSEINNREWLDRFRREAKILARLDHPNIIRILDFGSFKTDYYISFEYFDSRNLRQIIQNKNFSTANKRTVLIQLLRGLSAAHRNGIIHRDVKPENILVNDLWQVKLADFGLALSTRESKVTRKTSLIGTPAYMSPEQIRGEQLNEKSDLFSSGIVAFEMYRGFHPFLGNDAKSTINTILSFSHQAVIKKLAVEDPRIIAELLQPDPEMRPSSAKEVLQKLGADPNESEPILPHQSHVQKRTYRFIGVSIIISIIVIFSYLIISESVKQNLIPTEQTLKNDSIITIVGTPDAESHNAKDQKNENQVESDIIQKNDQRNEELAIGQMGALFLITKPECEVYINEEYHGKTPFRSPLQLPAGIIHLKLTHDQFPDYVENIEIVPEETKIINYDLDTLYGYLSCQIYPWGMILVDGKLIGETPLPGLIRLAPGKHLVVVENPGYQTFSDSLVIARKETTLYRINLEKRGNK